MIETIRKMDSDISKEVLLTMQVVPRDKFVEETETEKPETKESVVEEPTKETETTDEEKSEEPVKEETA